MGKNMRRFHLLLILLSLYPLAACSGNISGKVFLDRNGDNKLSIDEPILANLPTTLYQDDAEVERQTTGDDGMVEYLMQKKGKFCIRVDATQLSSLKFSDPSAAPASKNLTMNSSEATPEPTPVASASPQPSPSPSGQSTTSSSQPVNTVKAYEACTETKFPTNVSLDVPVPVSYSDTIASVPDPADQSVKPGDVLELTIDYPKYCHLENLTLPDQVSVQKTSGEWSHDVDWADAITQGGKPIVDQAPVAINRDGLREFPLTVKVSDTLGSTDQDQSISITPQVSCPGGINLSLKTHVLKIPKQSMFELYHDREGQAVAGGEVTIITHVINKTNLSFAAGDVNLIFTAPEYGDTSFDPECGGSHCSFSLDPNQHKDLKTKIKIPNTLTQTTTFQLSAQLKVMVNGNEKVYGEDSPLQFGVIP